VHARRDHFAVKGASFSISQMFCSRLGREGRGLNIEIVGTGGCR